MLNSLTHLFIRWFVLFWGCLMFWALSTFWMLMIGCLTGRGNSDNSSLCREKSFNLIQLNEISLVNVFFYFLNYWKLLGTPFASPTFWNDFLKFQSSWSCVKAFWSLCGHRIPSNIYWTGCLLSSMCSDNSIENQAFVCECACFWVLYSTWLAYALLSYALCDYGSVV